METISSFFTFDFVDEHDDEEDAECTNRIFRFDLLAPISFYEDFYGKYNEFEDKSMNMEMYGVHDCCGHEGDLEGFTSYEIVPDQYNDVMLNWREWFIQHGFSAGPVYEVPVNKSGNEKRLPKGEAARRRKVWDDLNAIRYRVM